MRFPAEAIATVGLRLLICPLVALAIPFETAMQRPRMALEQKTFTLHDPEARLWLALPIADCNSAPARPGIGRAARHAGIRASARPTEDRDQNRPQRVPRLMRLYFREGCGSATATRMRGDITGGLCGT